MLAVVERRRPWQPAAAAILAVLLAAYAFIAILDQPLAAGNDAVFIGLPNQSTSYQPPTQPALDQRPPILVLGYVDRGVDTLVQSLANTGSTALTITGVETNRRPGWAGLVTIEDARAAVVLGPQPCCHVDEAATWSAPSFRAITVGAGQQGVIAVHFLLSNCEDNGPGVYVIIDSIKIDYAVLGFPHAADVAIGPYWFASPDTCPRAGPARPA